MNESNFSNKSLHHALIRVSIPFNSGDNFFIARQCHCSLSVIIKLDFCALSYTLKCMNVLFLCYRVVCIRY